MFEKETKAMQDKIKEFQLQILDKQNELRIITHKVAEMGKKLVSVTLSKTRQLDLHKKAEKALAILAEKASDYKKEMVAQEKKVKKIMVGNEDIVEDQVKRQESLNVLTEKQTKKEVELKQRERRLIDKSATFGRKEVEVNKLEEDNRRKSILIEGKTKALETQKNKVKVQEVELSKSIELSERSMLSLDKSKMDLLAQTNSYKSAGMILLAQERTLDKKIKSAEDGKAKLIMMQKDVETERKRVKEKEDALDIKEQEVDTKELQVKRLIHEKGISDRLAKLKKGK